MEAVKNMPIKQALDHIAAKMTEDMVVNGTLVNNCNELILDLKDDEDLYDKNMIQVDVDLIFFNNTQSPQQVDLSYQYVDGKLIINFDTEELAHRFQNFVKNYLEENTDLEYLEINNIFTSCVCGELENIIYDRAWVEETWNEYFEEPDVKASM